MATLPIAISQPAIDDFYQRHHIRKLSLFGSVLTPRFHQESDVDFLVEFEPAASISYFDLVGMEMELSEVIGRKGDRLARAQRSGA